MTDRLLVAYATKAGATAEVAEAIADVLRRENADVDVMQARDVTDVTPYDAVVLGTGVRIGQVYGDAVAFLERHKETLSQVPVALYVVCMTMREDTEENRCTAEGYLDAVREKAPRMEPVSVGLFAGELDYGKIRPPLTWVLKLMKQPEGDFRDWDAIREWAEGLRPALQAG
jgi:menaquinone-dependent protoporphyrinogen oxidase